MPNKQIVILGAGLAGLSTAYHLGQKGINYNLFEKEKETGGLCRTKRINGSCFDYSGHLLHFRDPYTHRLVKKLLCGNLIRHRRKSSIYSFGCLTPYPFQINLYGLPENILNECIFGFINASQRQVSSKNSSFLRWITNTFGEGIARYFMIPYNEKFWKHDLNVMTNHWVNKYIPVPNLEEVMRGALGYSNKEVGYNSYFWYIRQGGINQLPPSLGKRVTNLHLKHEAVKIDARKRRVFFDNGSNIAFSHLVSSLPLTEIVSILSEAPQEIISAAQKLRWISIFNLNLVLKRTHISDQHWTYFPEKKYIFCRVGYPHNFSTSPAAAKRSSLYAEVSYLPEQKLDKDKMSQQIIDDLINAEVI